MVAAMLSIHKLLRTWEEQVDVMIVSTRFVRDKLTSGGFPDSKVEIKPNYIPDINDAVEKQDHFVYVGRLSGEKGLSLLLEAMDEVSGMPLSIIGDGPMFEETLERAARMLPGQVRVNGRVPNAEVMQLIASARFLVFPTLVYEGFGRVIVEAYAGGVPVIASRIGSPAELVEDGVTGLLFTPGDPKDLAAKIQWMIDHPERVSEMGRNARAVYESRVQSES